MKLKMRGSRIINGYPNMWQEKDSADAKLSPKRLKKSSSRMIWRHVTIPRFGG
jgi:hypothetical protein